jgi:hypothetical protein
VAYSKTDSKLDRYPTLAAGFRACLRHHYDEHQVFGGSYEDNKQRARVFFETFIDGTFKEKYAPHTDFVEEWNEYLAQSQNATEIDQRVTWAKAAAEVWRDYLQHGHRKRYTTPIRGGGGVTV